MPLLRVEPRLLGIVTCSLVTILIVLTQLPLLASLWFVFPDSQSESRNKKVNSASWLSNIWHFFRGDPNDFLSRLLTIEETWFYPHKPETKQLSVEWRHSSATHPKISECKNKLGNFWPQLFGINRRPSHCLSSNGPNYQRGMLLISAGVIKGYFEGKTPREDH